MAIKLSDGFACPICGARYSKEIDADSCKNSHELLYIPMTKTELNRLINALFLNQPELIPDSLLETLRKYQGVNFK